MDWILETITGIYDAALDGDGWNRLTSALVQGFGATSGVVHLSTGAGVPLGATGSVGGWDATDLAAYEAHYWRVDPWASSALRMKVFSPTVGQALASDRVVRRSEYYNDWARRFGVFNTVGSRIVVGPDRVGTVAFHRPEARDPFARADCRRLAVLMPHMARALQLHGRLFGLVRDRQLALGALEALAPGALVVAADARLLFASPLAERHLQAGRAIVLRHGRLAAGDPRWDAALQRAIQAACAAGARRLSSSQVSASGRLALPRPDAPPLLLTVCPFVPGGIDTGPPQPVALIFLGDRSAATGWGG